MNTKVLPLILLSGIASVLTADAIPAKRGLRDIRQPDGSIIRAELTGDEHFHYYMSEDGLPMLPDGNGALRHAIVERPESASASSGIRSRALTSGKDRANLCSGTISSSGDVPVLVILVQYKDIHFTHPSPATYFGDMLNKDGFCEYGGSGCAREYFIQQSSGQFRPRFDVAGPVTLPQYRSSYGGNNTSGNDKAPEDMLAHAAAIIDEDVDFSIYDTDKDGIVDNVFIFYAGQGEATYGPSSSVWPHTGELSEKGKSFTLDGVEFNRYCCANEWENDKPCGIGPFIHEFSHALGLPDLSHSTNTGAIFTPGEWSVMDYGCHNNEGRTPPNYSIFERYALGWAEPEALRGPATVSLGDTGSSVNNGFIIPTERENEFFLLENRQNTGWDACLPGHGMLIWHIDYIRDLFSRNTVNDIEAHQCVDIVEAGGEANSRSSTVPATYTWPGSLGKTAFTGTSSPALKSWNGKEIPLPLTEISENEDGTITFNVAGGAIISGTPTGLSASPKSDGSAVLQWSAVEGADSYLVNLYTKDNEGEPDSHILEDFMCAGTELSVKNLASGREYFLTVRAVRGMSTGPESDEMPFIMPVLSWGHIVPEADTSAEFEDGCFTARWLRVPDATGYLLTIATGSEGSINETILDFGNSSTVRTDFPTGWTWNGSENDLYLQNSTGFYGDSAPALKFNMDGSTLTSPLLDNPASAFSFWLRGAPSAAESTLRVEGLDADSDEWLALHALHPATEAGGQTVSKAVSAKNIRRLRFVYDKVHGNMAFDDLSILTSTGAVTPTEEWTDLNVGDTDRYTVKLTRPYARTYYFSVKAVNASGEVSRASEPGIVAVPAQAGLGLPETSETIITDGLTLRCNSKAGATIAVYGLMGQAIASTRADNNGYAELRLPASGMYIVVHPDGARKIRATDE